MAFLGLLLRSFLFWFGAIWFVAGGIVAGSGIEGMRKARYAAQTRRPAEAVVVSKLIQRADRGDNPRTRYEIMYRFTVGGFTYQRTAEVGVERWEALTEGQPIRIFYLPDDDFHTSQIDDYSSDGELVGVVAGILVLLVGGYLIVRESRLAMARVAAAESAPLLIDVVMEAGARFLQTALSLAKVLGIVLVAVFVAELVPPIKSAALYIDQRQSPLLAWVVGIGVVGFILMMGGILHLVVVSKQPSESFSVDSMKDAWRAKAYRTSVVWRRRFITAAGAALLFVGIYGLLIVIGPAWIKLLMASAIAYVVARTAMGKKAN